MRHKIYVNGAQSVGGGTLCAELKHRLMEKFILCRKIKNHFLKQASDESSKRGGVRALCQGRQELIFS